MTTQNFSIDEDLPESAESVADRREREQRLDLSQGEIIPLVPNADKNPNRAVFAIQVHKKDAPNDGYKGDVSPYTTMSTIAKLYGNGLYDFAAVNEAGKVLRRNSGVKINMVASPDTPPQRAQAQPAADASLELLRMQTAEHRFNSEKVENFGKAAIASSQSQAEKHIQLVSETAKATIERDREFFATQAAQTQNFFGAMIAAITATHQQAMERSEQSFKQVLTIMLSSAERERESNNPMLLMQVLREGLTLGRDMGGDNEDDNPITATMKYGLGGLKEIKEMMLLKSMQPAAKPKKLAKANPAGQSKTASQPTKKAALSREQLKRVIVLKNIMEQKGMDFDAMVAQASQHMAGASADEEESDETDDSEESEDGETTDDVAPNGSEEDSAAHVD